tara:strand:+ start:3470 stop:3643 length:174 start_codon:yes stop_codon:yes gene_type:complete
MIFDNSPLPSSYDEKIRFINFQIRKTKKENLTHIDFIDTINFWKTARDIEISKEFNP